MASSAVPCRFLLEKMVTRIFPIAANSPKMAIPSQKSRSWDIVLVVAENTSQNHWPLGRIQEVFPDKKGFVHKVKVSIKSAILAHPVDKIVLLVEEERSKRT